MTSLGCEIGSFTRARTLPWSKSAGFRSWRVIPVEVSWLRIAVWIGEQPRRSGRREGWMFNPRYLAPFNILGGTKRPNETAMMRFISGFMGGDQPVNVSRS